MGKLAIFIGGLVLGAVGAFVGLLYLEMHKQPPDDQIVFAPKNFVDVNEGTESGKRPAARHTGVGIFWARSVGSGGTDAHPNGVRNVPCASLQRPRRARWIDNG